MKMMYNGTQIKSLNIKHYEMDSNFATVEPSDMQAGKTAVARGKKITGTGKSFSFASYGRWKTNESSFIPMVINTVQIGSTDYPVKTTVQMTDTHSCDFTTPQEIAEVVVDGITYPMLVSVVNGEFLVTCDKTINIEFFIGKDEYI